MQNQELEYLKHLGYSFEIAAMGAKITHKDAGFIAGFSAIRPARNFKTRVKDMRDHLASAISHARDHYLKNKPKDKTCYPPMWYYEEMRKHSCVQSF